MNKCIKCGAEATKRISPDLDIEGIGMCDEHEEEVKLDWLVACYSDFKKFNNKYKNKKWR
jgi:hypothetical protein